MADAFEKYVPRIGRAPAPMTADYAALLNVGRVWVIDGDGDVAGVIACLPRADHLLVDVVAVASGTQGAGYGSMLLQRAEIDAAELSLPEVRLSTNVAMTENIGYYARRGYVETGRGVEDGYDRVFFAKRVGGA